MVNNTESVFTSSNSKKEILIMMELLKCPECKSLAVWKHGFYVTKNEKKQKYKCVKCGHIWRQK